MAFLPILVFICFAAAFWFGWRLLPKDGFNPGDGRVYWCCRLSYLTLVVPLLVILMVALLLVWRVRGGPGLMAFGSQLALASKLWMASSFLGLSLAVVASVPVIRARQSMELIVIHLASLFFVVAAQYAPYAVHPD